MGFLENLMGVGSYEPGGEHYVKITDQAFERAIGELQHGDSPYAGSFTDYAARLMKPFDIEKYEAHDFPVAHIVTVFCLAHYFQEESNGTPENLRIGYIEIGRKDEQDCQKWLARWKDKLPSDKKGLVGALQKGIDSGNAYIETAAVIGGLTRGLAKGVARVVTGKSEDMRLFERLYANYISGDSVKAKEYVTKFAEKFGAFDDGVIGVCGTIMCIFWTCEISRANRARQ